VSVIHELTFNMKYCLSLRCSAYRQVHGIQLLHSSLFSAFLFILPYDNSTNSSSSIPFRGLPLTLFPSILPSITSLNNPSPLNTCPMQFFCLFLIKLLTVAFLLPYSKFPHSLSCCSNLLPPSFSISTSPLPPIF